MTGGGGISTPPPPAPPASPARSQTLPVVIRDAPVTSLPPGLVNADAKVIVEAKVAEIRAAAQQIVLQTEQGMVVIQSSARLPPGTPVTIELDPGRTPLPTATVSLAPAPPLPVPLPLVSAQQAVAPFPETAQLPPPLPHEVFSAVILTEQKTLPPPAAVTTPAPVTSDQALPLDVGQAVAQLKNFLLADDAPFPVASQPLAGRTAFTPDFPAVLPTSDLPLPPAVPRKMALALGLLSLTAETVVAPVVATKGKTATPPALLPSPAPLAGITTPGTAVIPEAPFDANIRELAGARIHARLTATLLGDNMARTPIGNAPAAPARTPPVNLIRGTIASLLEYLSGQPPPPAAAPGKTTPAAERPALPHSDGLRQTSLRVLAILPPAPSPQQITQTLQMPPGEWPVDARNILPLVARSGGTTPAGQIFLESPAGHIILQTTARAIPKGALVIAEIATTPAPAVTLPALPATGLGGIQIPDFDPLTAKNWPAMEDALKLLANPASTIPTPLQGSLPTPGPKLASTALFFLAALKGTKIENWLGQASLDMLKDSGHAKLAERLGSDFTRMARQATETLAGDWKAVSLPLLHDDQVSRLLFFVRQQPETPYGGRDNDRARDGGKQPTTRFVLNLELSRMGSMQLDGLHRQGRLDIVLRTRENLPAEAMSALTQKYAQAMEQTRMAGQIAFQTKGWVEPLAQNTATAGVSA